MKIRRAREGDAPALCVLAVESKEVWGYSPRDIERWRADLRISADEIKARPTFVAEVEDAIAGFYSLIRCSPRRRNFRSNGRSPQLEKIGEIVR